jgi:hypothetical protein
MGKLRKPFHIFKDNEKIALPIPLELHDLKKRRVLFVSAFFFCFD